MAKHIFKVWDCTREKKVAVLIDSSDSLLDNLILKGNNLL